MSDPADDRDARWAALLRHWREEDSQSDPRAVIDGASLPERSALGRRRWPFMVTAATVALMFLFVLSRLGSAPDEPSGDIATDVVAGLEPTGSRDACAAVTSCLSDDVYLLLHTGP